MQKLLQFGVLALGAIFVNKALSDEDDVTSDISKSKDTPHLSGEAETAAITVSETVADPSFAEVATVSQTDVETLLPTVEKQKNTVSYRRGDRFICPETGEALQVRAVGGRPPKARPLPSDDSADILQAH